MLPEFEAILYVQTAPTVEPLSLAEAKNYCHTKGNSENDEFERWIKGAREQIENWTNRTLLQTTYKLTANRFPASAWNDGRAAKPKLMLPRPPFASLTSVKYYDGGGTQITMTGADYQLVQNPLGAYLMPAIGRAWPATQAGREDAVEVIWVAGYGSTASTVPASLREAIGHLVEHSRAVRGVQTDLGTPAMLKARDLCWAFFVPHPIGVRLAA